LNGHALSIKRGQYLLFLGEICPHKKTPKPCPFNGTIARILLTKHYETPITATV
jgi:hypothetical protein